MEQSPITSCCFPIPPKRSGVMSHNTLFESVLEATAKDWAEPNAAPLMCSFWYPLGLKLQIPHQWW